MKTSIILFVLLALATPVLAQETNADAHYLKRRYEYTLKSDGSQVMTYSHELKIITPYSFNRAYGESFIVYNPGWQTLKVDKSVTKMADGRMVESPYNAYNEVLPSFAHNIAPYNNLREMVVTHTGLEPGSIINLEYTITTKAGFYPGVMDRILLAQRSPADVVDVVVRIPKGQTLKFDVTGSDRPLPAKMTDGDYDMYAWKFRDLPLINVEDNQPGLWQFAPKLVFSSVTEQELAHHMMPDDAVMEIDAETKAIAHEAVAGVDGDVSKALALQKFLQGKIAVMHGGLEYTGYKPMPAQETWNRAAGSELDIAVLFAAMCKSVGVDAVPALYSDTRQVEGEAHIVNHDTSKENPLYPEIRYLSTSNRVPYAQQFTAGAISVPYLNEKQTMTDMILEAAGTQNTQQPIGLVDAYILPLGITGPPSRDPFIECYQPMRESSISSASDWSIKEGGLVSGRTAVEATGAFAYDFNPDAMGKGVAKALKSAGWGLSADAEKAEALGEAYSKCEVKVESNSGPVGDGFMRFALPAYGHLNGLHVKTTSAPRQTPVDFKTKFAEKHLMTLHYPAGMKPVALPEKVEIQNAAGSIRSIFIDHGGDIEIIRSIDLPDNVQPEHYNDLKVLMDVWNDPARSEVVFVKN